MSKTLLAAAALAVFALSTAEGRVVPVLPPSVTMRLHDEEARDDLQSIYTTIGREIAIGVSSSVIADYTKSGIDYVRQRYFDESFDEEDELALQGFAGEVVKAIAKSVIVDTVSGWIKDGIKWVGSRFHEEDDVAVFDEDQFQSIMLVPSARAFVQSFNAAVMEELGVDRLQGPMATVAPTIAIKLGPEMFSTLVRPISAQTGKDMGKFFALHHARVFQPQQQQQSTVLEEEQDSLQMISCQQFPDAPICVKLREQWAAEAKQQKTTTTTTTASAGVFEEDQLQAMNCLAYPNSEWCKAEIAKWSPEDRAEFYARLKAQEGERPKRKTAGLFEEEEEGAADSLQMVNCKMYENHPLCASYRARQGKKTGTEDSLQMISCQQFPDAPICVKLREQWAAEAKKTGTGLFEEVEEAGDEVQGFAGEVVKAIAKSVIVDTVSGWIKDGIKWVGSRFHEEGAELFEEEQAQVLSSPASRIFVQAFELKLMEELGVDKLDAQMTQIGTRIAHKVGDQLFTKLDRPTAIKIGNEMGHYCAIHKTHPTLSFDESELF